MSPGAWRFWRISFRTLLDVPGDPARKSRPCFGFYSFSREDELPKSGELDEISPGELDPLSLGSPEGLSLERELRLDDSGSMELESLVESDDELSLDGSLLERELLELEDEMLPIGCVFLWLVFVFAECVLENAFRRCVSPQCWARPRMRLRASS